MLWFYYTYFLPLAGSQWKIVSTGSGIIWFWRRVQNPEWVQEDLGGGPGTWEEDWKAAMQPYLPCRCTTSFPPEIPSSTIWLPTWNSDTLKSWNPEIPPTREKLILRMYKVKVAVVGPSQAGKTMISNFLADATENIGGEIGFCFCFMESLLFLKWAWE